jgi:hypothetical protein
MNIGLDNVTDEGPYSCQCPVYGLLAARICLFTPSPFFSDQVRGLLDQLAASIGPGHMLMQGGARHLSKMNAIMTGPTGGGGRSRA